MRCEPNWMSRIGTVTPPNVRSRVRMDASSVSTDQGSSNTSSTSVASSRSGAPGWMRATTGVTR